MGDIRLSACEKDDSQCPTSQRSATDVACNCRCVAGYSGVTPTREFSGTVSACLPPDLNPKLATTERIAELEAMPAAAFNQTVFKYCSDEVAGFLEELIGEQQRPPDLASMCMGPRIKCSCDTGGAKGETAFCSEPCADQTCDTSSCQPLLRVGGGIDTAGCACSRVNGCGDVSTPPVEAPPVCLNRIAAIQRRKAATPAAN